MKPLVAVSKTDLRGSDTSSAQHHRCLDNRLERMNGCEDEYIRRERLLLHHSYVNVPNTQFTYTPPAPPPQNPHNLPRYNTDRYIAPPPPAPAPSNSFSTLNNRYSDRYFTDRYLPNENRYLYERYEKYLPTDRYTPIPNNDRYASLDRHHTHSHTSHHGHGTSQHNTTDPYLRRDLGYHHHFRLPPPSNYSTFRRHHNNYATYNPSRTVRCCPGVYNATSSSPISSTRRSSSASIRSVNSTSNTLSQTMPTPNIPVVLQSPNNNSSGNVEYVGSSGGRFVSTTPPLPRCNSINEVAQDLDAAGANTLSLCCAARKSQQLTSPQNINAFSPLTTPHSNSSNTWRRSISCSSSSPPTPPTNMSNISSSSSNSMPNSLPCSGSPPSSLSSSSAMDPSGAPPPGPSKPSDEPLPSSSLPPLPAEAFGRPKRLRLQQQVSMPVTAQEVQHVTAGRRYAQPVSRTDAVKNFLKRETAVFFGVHEATEDLEKARWLDRRKRLAARKYGPLKHEYQRSLSAYTNVTQQPDVLPSLDEHDMGAESTGVSSLLNQDKNKPSVAKMTVEGVAYLVNTLHKKKSRAKRSASTSAVPSGGPCNKWLRTCGQEDPGVHEDDVFFDDIIQGDLGLNFGGSAADDKDVTQTDGHSRDTRLSSWKREPRRHETTEIGLNRIWDRILDRTLDNSDRRQFGMGVVGRFFGRSYKRSVLSQEPIKEQLDHIEDHRPFFTYWITTVQIIILCLSIFAYGLGPFGFNLAHNSGLVLVTSLSLQQADLIHLGAKFAPCMRKDVKIQKEIDRGREKERETACCIRNDDSGCVQSSQQDCSKTISTWKKWSPRESGPGGRISGSVCGLDPKFCEAPASIQPYEWPDDITKWPICKKASVPAHPSHPIQKYKDKLAAEHMVCEVIGHPCCIGIHATCRITTKEYCDFVRGHFHEDASLCSQVSCLDNVCGMIPFYNVDSPDQFYRLWTSLFLHAGVIHLVISVIVQFILMRDLEKLTGSFRIAIIYFGSGIGGNLASAIFVPYRADVGPAGAHFGLLACLIVEVLNCWPLLKHPEQALMKLLTITFILLLFGLLPWVDNFAHLFGFLFGFLLSYALLPFVSFGPYDRQKKIFLIWVCLMFVIIFLVVLLLLFYLIPIYDCELCSYFNCIPFTNEFCADQNINLNINIDHIV
ncbi:hypothetical protein M8J76_008494 [Diaphorina citri]|nr:hypothetical protein M8J76_008494 [Diaphorina citri]